MPAEGRRRRRRAHRATGGRERCRKRDLPRVLLGRHRRSSTAMRPLWRGRRRPMKRKEKAKTTEIGGMEGRRRSEVDDG